MSPRIYDIVFAKRNKIYNTCCTSYSLNNIKKELTYTNAQILSIRQRKKNNTTNKIMKIQEEE